LRADLEQMFCRAEDGVVVGLDLEGMQPLRTEGRTAAGEGSCNLYLRRSRELGTSVSPVQSKAIRASCISLGDTVVTLTSNSRTGATFVGREVPHEHISN
jgi:hypothetical protein